jgi:hypothetical protein
MISVHESEKPNFQEIEQFLLAATELRFEASQRKEVYAWVERLLCQREYDGRPLPPERQACVDADSCQPPFADLGPHEFLVSRSR